GAGRRPDKGPSASTRAVIASLRVRSLGQPVTRHRLSRRTAASTAAPLISRDIESSLMCRAMGQTSTGPGPGATARTSHGRLTDWGDGTGLGRPHWTPRGPRPAETDSTALAGYPAG